MCQGFPGYVVKSAGTEPGARIRVNEGHIGWADITKRHLTPLYSEPIVSSKGPRPFMDSIIAKLRVWPIWKQLKHFAVSAACEDHSATVRTDGFCRSLSWDLHRKCRVSKEIWLFSQLCIPQLRAIAAGEAALTQLIIISMHYSETLPDGVKSWIDLWLRQRNDHNAVLLALLDPISPGISSSMQAYLQDMSKKGDIEFLVHAEDAPDYR